MTDKWLDIFTGALAVFTGLSLAGVWYTIRAQRAAQRQIDALEKQTNIAWNALTVSYFASRTNVVLEMMKRYEQSRRRMLDRSATDEEDAVRSYWNLQLEQYQLYVLGFIEDNIFRYWMSLRRRDYNEPPFDGFRDMTTKALKSFRDAKFQSFMEDFVFKEGRDDEQSMSNLQDVMREARRRREENLGRLDPGLLSAISGLTRTVDRP